MVEPEKWRWFAMFARNCLRMLARPQQARQVTVTDIATINENQREELLTALLHHYAPGGFEALSREACNDAVHQYELTLTQHGRPRFQRAASAICSSPPASAPTPSALAQRGESDLELSRR